MVPLTQLIVGETGVVKRLDGGRGVVSRLTTLGFTMGAEVTTVQNFGRGPLIVALRDTRIALGRGQASKIQVVKKKPSR
jgi:ferrous iron transport protein A